MSLRENLVFGEAWSSAGASNTFPAVVTSEAEARTNLDSEHIATRNKINEIVGAIVPSGTDPEHVPDDNHIPTTGYVKEIVDAHNVQADWDQEDSSADDYIRHKPVIDAALNALSTNAIQNKAVTEAINSLSSAITRIISQMHPVGSVYISRVSTSPATLFGGTWTQIKDKFLLAAGDVYTAGATGGSATAALPQHSHKYDNIYIKSGEVSSGSRWILTADSSSGDEYSSKSAGHTEDTGSGSDPISIMPPYEVFYAWVRTA